MLGVVCFTYIGFVAISKRSLDTRLGFRASGPWFPEPLFGRPAVIAGVSFVSLAACLATIIITSYPPVSTRLPSSIVRTRWWCISIFFVLWTLLNWLANHLGRA